MCGDVDAGRIYYSLFMLLAFVAFFVARRLQPKWLMPSSLTWEQKSILLLSAFIGGAYAARIGAIVEAAPRSGFTWLAFMSDGKTITTGLLGAYLGVEFAKWIMRIRVKTGDAFAFPMAVGLAIGRWGCFFLGCCYGTPTALPWGVDFSPYASGLRHPTQIYESIFHLACAIILWQLIRSQMFRQQLLKLYLIAYCVFRFATELIRPAEPYALGLTFYQWVTTIFAVFLIVQWACDERAKRNAVGDTNCSHAS